MATTAPVADAPVAQEHDEDAPLLELSTLAPKRPTVNIKHKDEKGETVERLFELRINDDFGIEMQQRLARDGAEFERLWNTDDLKPAQRKRLKLLLDRMFNQVLDAPKEVREQLRDGQRAQVVLCFTLAPLAAAAKAQKSLETMAGIGSTTAS